MHLFVLLLLIAFAGPAQERPPSRAGAVAPAADYEQLLSKILEAVVTPDGSVQYGLLAGPLNADFRRVLKAVETFDAHTLEDDAEKMAFWMNAYNVQMLQHILEHPARRDVLGPDGGELFFKRPVLTARMGVSLDQIEQVILRRQVGPPELSRLAVRRLDPRIHVGLNCAARSCPPLPQSAFTARSVDAQLDAAMRAFAASETNLRVTSGSVVLTSLLDWYGDDFDTAGQPAGDYLLRYMPPARPGYDRLRNLLRGRTAAQIRARPDVSFAYDWRVNRAE